MIRGSASPEMLTCIRRVFKSNVMLQRRVCCGIDTVLDNSVLCTSTELCTVCLSGGFVDLYRLED